MEFLVTSAIVFILAPVLFGWALIGLAPLLIPVTALLYFFSINNRDIGSEIVDRKCVLVVDDEYESVIPLIKLLQQAKIPFKYVATGFDAIRELSRGRFRLVFMDLAMPHLTGAEALTKADEVIPSGESATPVVIYSGSQIEQKTPHRLKHLSVVDSWSKSMNLLKLHSKLNRVLVATSG
jgi:CheY-like chemotaxis protein